VIVAAAITLPLGITQSKEYAELEWPIDILITLVWVAYGIVFFGTIMRRRVRHLFVAKYRKFKRPFLAVWRLGGSRASAGLGTDRTSVSGISASPGRAASPSVAIFH